MRNAKTVNWTMCAMMAAVTGILSQIVVPIGLVPINMATLSVMLAGGLLGAKYGALSQIVYVLLGMAGVPVFAGFFGGVARIAGPTGGYIVGYVLMAWITGFCAERRGRKNLPLVVGMILGTAALYTLGTAWFMFSRGMGLASSLAMCVIPFLPMDAVKIALVTVLVGRVHKMLPAWVGA